MKIKWLGHSSFLITANDGTRIVTDPYVTGGGLKYDPINEDAEIVLTSHGHDDHANVAAIGGNPKVVNSVGKTEVKGIKINGVASFHDAANGDQRGENIIFKFMVDDVSVCHLGDLGHKLSASQVSDIGEVDVLLTPIGGNFTIDASEATAISTMIGPKTIIPMHFKNEKCDFPIAGLEYFMEGFVNIDAVVASEKEFEKINLPAATKVLVLKPAM